MKQQYYHFVSRWRIQAPPIFIDELILEKAAEWWVGLESMVQLPGSAKKPHYRCVWHSKSGYRLSITLMITEYQRGQRIEFCSSGDLIGTGSFVFSSDENGATYVTIRWDVATTKWWMNFFAPLLRPLFIKNHHDLMVAGGRGLREYVSR